MLLLVVRFCLKSFQLSSLWFLKKLIFFSLCLHHFIFLFPNSNFFEFSEFCFSVLKLWFWDDNHLTKSESGSMMVRFDTYDWTDSRIGWVRYESFITCRWISCSYLLILRRKNSRNWWRFLLRFEKFTRFIWRKCISKWRKSVDLQFRVDRLSWEWDGIFVHLIRTELFSLFLDSHQTIDCIELCWNWLSRHKCRTRLKSWSDQGSTKVKWGHGMIVMLTQSSSWTSR